jgi:predicted deacylase
MSEKKMNKNILQIGGINIPPKSNQKIALELPKHYHIPAAIPLQVMRGSKEGPTLFVSAAVHGDEMIGIEIIRRLKKLSILKKLKGTLILVPVVNVYGLTTLSRYLPDRRDLNRSFPGSSKGSIAARIAKIFFDEVVKKSDYGIDLHTGAIHRSNLPQIRTNINNIETLRLAKAFEAPVILHSQLRDKSLRSEAQEEGVPILLYEAGEALRFDETAIKIGVKGVINVLKALDMLPQTKKKRYKNPLIFNHSSWIRAPESGMLRTVKGLGDSVKKDQLIGFIDDPISDEVYEIQSTFDGIIIGKVQIPMVQEGDAVFHIARFDDLDIAENRIEYFQEDAIERSDILGLNEEYPIE